MLARSETEWTWTFLLLILALPGCGGRGDHNRPADTEPPATKTPAMNDTLSLSSAAFDNGSAIPEKHTADAADVSPPLAWSGAPAGTKSWAVVCDDPDAPSPRTPGPEPWVHWVAYNIPAEAASLPENAGDASVAADVTQGRNSWPSDNAGYRGPAPPPGSGTHRYFFKLYAVDTLLDLDPDTATKAALLAALDGHVLAEAEWMGTFERTK